MFYGLLADALVLVHVAFVVFVMLGGLLVWKWHRLAWVHLPAVAWGVWIEWSGGICPLTPLENWLRAGSGEGTYPGDFIQHYVLPCALSRRTHAGRPDRARRAGARDQRRRVLVCMEEDQD